MSKKEFDYYSMEEDKDLEKEMKKGKKTIFSITIIMVILLFIGIGFGIVKGISFIGEKISSSVSTELIEEKSSGDGKYTVKTYLINGGATTSYAVKGILYEGDKKVKDIYLEDNMENGDISWVDSDTVKINDKEIDILK
ncbi:MAG: DUF5412 family protein [Clostridium sp.]